MSFELEKEDKDMHGRKITVPCTYRELEEALTKHLKNVMFDEANSHYDFLDYILTEQPWNLSHKMSIPEFRWIYSFVVWGSNEGAYFHVACYSIKEQKHINLITAKTLSTNTDLVLTISKEINRFILIHTR